MSVDSTAAVLASFAHQTSLSRVPDDVQHAAKLHIMDTLGCAVAAYADGEEAVSAAVRAFSDLHGAGPATALGSGIALSTPGAAFVNSAASHSQDFDDTHYGAMVNVGAVVVPPVLAIAQQHRIDGATSLAAILVGAEAMIRLGLACRSAFDTAGFHPTSTCGAFAAALAASRAMGLSEPAIRRALGVAGSFAAGTYEPIHGRSSAKALQVGGAAQAGVVSAALAAAGAEGPDSSLDGAAGLFRTYFGLAPDTSLAPHLADLGSTWETPNISFRAFPACTFLHGALEAAQELLDGQLSTESIRRVRVSIAAEGAPLVAVPWEMKLSPRTGNDVRFSLPYAVGQALVHGIELAGVDATAALDDPQVAAVAQLVEYVPRDFGPSSFPGSVEIELENGRRSAEVRFHRGGMSRPLSSEDVRDKFIRNVAPVVGDREADDVATDIMRLESHPDVSALMDCLVTPRREKS